MFNPLSKYSTFKFMLIEENNGIVKHGARRSISAPLVHYLPLTILENENSGYLVNELTEIENFNTKTYFN